jgi:EAL domain-containing protein (putative c-di-GMP-specific phosphodiesterase class I)
MTLINQLSIKHKTYILVLLSVAVPLIAEGVETKRQQDFLLDNGCANIQGYFLSKPVPAAELEVYLKKTANL